jgi:uncharacterized protein (TIGR00369 family)
MGPDEHFRKLERMYHDAPINRFYEPHLNVGPGSAEIRLKIKPDFFHAASAVHGSVYFKLLDDAAYFAVNSKALDAFVLTVSFNIYLVRPVSEGQLLARGRVVHASRNLFVAESELMDDADRLVARGSGTFMKSQTGLSDVSGYR